MPVDLVSLAFGTGTTPLPNVLVDGGPDDFAADDVLGGPDATMLVVGIEESPGF